MYVYIYIYIYMLKIRHLLLYYSKSYISVSERVTMALWRHAGCGWPVW